MTNYWLMAVNGFTIFQRHGVHLVEIFFPIYATHLNPCTTRMSNLVMSIVKHIKVSRIISINCSLLFNKIYVGSKTSDPTPRLSSMEWMTRNRK